MALLDSHWTSGEGVDVSDRYDLLISAGAVQVTLDELAAADARPPEAPPEGERQLSDASMARELLLEGIEHRLVGRHEPGG